MFKPGKLNVLREQYTVTPSNNVKQAQKDAHDIATHYVTTRCVNSDPIVMGAAVYCAAYDGLIAGGGKWAVRMNCEPLVTQMELSNAAPVKPVARKARNKNANNNH